jgi:uncharacterized protein
VLITPTQLLDEPLRVDVSILPGAIEYTEDVRQTSPVPVRGEADLIVERHGPHALVQDIRLRAAYSGNFEILCARCAEPVTRSLSGSFDLLFRPGEADAGVGERSITPDETEIGYYQESGLLLEDVVREQVLLSLPARTLCAEDCKGLCPRCGQNLNLAACGCGASSRDPRWSSLADLARGIERKP